MRQLIVEPIGHARTPFLDKAEAPRQATAARDVAGTIELLPAYADALSDLEGFERIWLLFWFDRVEGWRPKVQPPRSEEKRGLFATRSPHRPNPIGLSAVRLDRVDGLVLHIRDVDLVDETPILDIKPYIPYADAFPDAGAGWLEPTDPGAQWSVRFEPAAEQALAWIREHAGADLRERVVAALSLGPRPHAYRRIREVGNGRRVLAVKEWRATFQAVDGGSGRGGSIIVEAIASGYRPRELATGTLPVHEVHRAFAAAMESPS